ncbi:MAG: DNA-processing protein DprA [Bacteroidota bacterium]
MQPLYAQLALSFLPKVGPVTARNLVSYCGGAAAVFKTPKRQLLKIPGIGPQLAKTILKPAIFPRVETELRFIEKHQVKPLFYLDADYPQRLKHYNDSPILLFAKGNLQLNAQRHIAIVGTRQPSTYGMAQCEQLVQQLGAYEVSIISGLAYGIDICAHRQCVKQGISTVGVLGHGLHLLYPAQHFAVAEKMQERGGLLSEYPSFAGPDREHFPMRNRIIAALCDALVVVETKAKGGSMITAQLANQYNKDVFAFPGRTTDPRSAGCNLLIKSHQAALIESFQDLIYVLGWNEERAKHGIQKQLFVELGADEKLIVDLLQEFQQLHVDQIRFQSGIINSKLASLLLELEFKGVIKSLPGNRYTLIQ